MKTLRLRFTGELPLLLHNGQLANPFYSYTKAIKKITAKKRKMTDADLEEKGRLEWFGSLYLNENKEIIVPAELVEASIRDAAKKTKRGRDVTKGLVCRGVTRLDIGRDHKLDALWADQDNFVFAAMVKVGQSRVLRIRPIFRSWSFEAEIQFDDTVLDPEDIKDFAARAYFGDWRPKFGQGRGEIIG